jgi:hypothetical protein
MVERPDADRALVSYSHKEQEFEMQTPISLRPPQAAKVVRRIEFIIAHSGLTATQTLRFGKCAQRMQTNDGQHSQLAKTGQAVPTGNQIRSFGCSSIFVGEKSGRPMTHRTFVTRRAALASVT